MKNRERDTSFADIAERTVGSKDTPRGIEPRASEHLLSGSGWEHRIRRIRGVGSCQEAIGANNEIRCEPVRFGRLPRPPIVVALSEERRRVDEPEEVVREGEVGGQGELRLRQRRQRAFDLPAVLFGRYRHVKGRRVRCAHDRRAEFVLVLVSTKPPQMRSLNQYRALGCAWI